MALELQRYRFTTDEYHRMAEAGILGEDDRVELIEGEIIQMSPIGRRHIAGVDRLTRHFVLGARDAAIVRIQSPIRLDTHNEPQPDLTLLRPRADFYADADAAPADVFLIVEVADSSVDYDRQIKAPLYARHGIPEYWLIDVGREHVVVYGGPTSDGYATTRVARRGEKLAPTVFPSLEIAVDDILG